MLRWARREKDEYVDDFVGILRACAKTKDLNRGLQLHADILRLGLLGKCLDALVTLYARCGVLEKAKELFSMYKSTDVVTWTALIAAYAQKGDGQNAIYYFEQMQEENLFPDAVTFNCILKACGSIGAAEKGQKIHGEIFKLGLLKKNIILGNALVDMYVKCNDLAKAQEVLEELPVRNVITWNSLMAGYANHDEGAQALECYKRMQGEGVSPDAVTYICILNACGSIRSVEKGKEIHDEITKQGLLGNDVVLGTALVDMYAKCGALAKARQVLEELPSRNVISWSALIAGYAQHNQGFQALSGFEQMQREGLTPNAATFIGILKACSNMKAADKGEEIHDAIAKQGLLADNIELANALVDMYAKCGALTKAKQLLEELPCRSVIAWNALIAGFAQEGKSEQALDCLEAMKREGVIPDAVTFTCLLKACGSAGAADKGEKLHDEISELGLFGSNIVLGSALVDMYVKCGALGKAQQVLDELPYRNIISWSSLIAGYVEENDGERAIECFEQMQREGLCPDAVTFISLLKACGKLGAADKGQQIHDELSQQGVLYKDIVLGTAVVDMYAKCGALAKAQKALQELPVRDVISWNALIAGHTQQCEGSSALKCFEQMEQEGLCPNAATFSSVLSACSRSSKVEDALVFFANMSTKYGMKPNIEHYTCMVDLLGRTGCLYKAVGIIDRLPSSFGGVWSALLGACEKTGDVNVGRWAFEHAIQVDKYDAGFYILMANICASAGMEEEVARIEAMRVENKAWRKSVCGW